MYKRATLICLAAGLCTGVTCTIRFPDDGNGGGGGLGLSTPLDQADAVIAINQSGDNTQAEAAARITDGLGLTVQMQDGQSVAVNSQELTGPGSDGLYRQTIPVAGNYTVTVTEPTRGVQDTTIASPAGFVITSPTDAGTASLSGFTLTWSDPDARFTVVIELAQTLFDVEETAEFGPFADTGSQSFDDDDLLDFAQGADLLITVTRINEQSSIAGFNSGMLTIRHSETVSATPGP